MPAKPVRFDIADAGMALTVLIWSANNVIVKAALDRIAPFPYVLSRFAIVSVVYFALLTVRRVDLRIRRRDWARLAVCGVSGFTLSNLLYTFGLDHTTSFSVAVLLSLAPIFTMLFASIVKIETSQPAQWLGAIVAFVGVAVFVNVKLDGFPVDVGTVLTTLSAACFAVFSLAARPLVRTYGSPSVTAWSCLIGLVALTPFALPASIKQDWSALGFGGWTAVFYASVVSVIFAYTILGWAIQRRGVGKTVVMLFFEPVITGVLAVIFLHEHLTAPKLAGAGLVLVGVQLARSQTAFKAGARFVFRKWNRPAAAVSTISDDRALP